MKKWGKQLLIVTSIFIFTAAIILTTQIYFTGNSVNENSISSNRGLNAGEQCSDGIDNDGDGLTDLGDVNCWTDSDNNESGIIYYVCECNAESDANCVNGSDSNDGLSNSTPWKTYSKARTQFSSLNPGEVISFCRGGVFYHNYTDGFRWVNNNCLADDRCIIRDYVAPWANGNENKPIIQSTDDQTYGFDLADGSNSDHEEGYVFNNLDIRGIRNIAQVRGFFFYNDIDNVSLENLNISGFSLGVDIEGFNTPNPGSDGYSDGITIKNSSMINNSGQGWLGSCNDCIIEDSYFENNGWGGEQSLLNRNHNIYYSSTRHSFNSIIRNNRLYRSSLNNTGTCYGVSLVVHGNHTNLIIQNNTIWEDIGKADASCWGIAVDQGGSEDVFKNLRIDGNKVINVGNLGIGCTCCQDSYIENNLIVQEQDTASTLISLPTKTLGDNSPGDGDTFNITIRHNTLFMNSSAQTLGITAAISPSTGPAPNTTITGNLIMFTDANTNTGTPNFCFQLGPEDSYKKIDYNLCNFTSNTYWVANASDWFNFNNWAQLSGFDNHSLVGDADFVNYSEDLSLNLGSDAIDKVPLNLCSSHDFLRVDRPIGSLCDIGAYEYASYNCTEIWSCSDWNTCTFNEQSRTCTDSNSCGTILNKPIETQSCIESVTSGGSSGGGGGGRTTPINNGTNSTTSNFTTESIGTISDNGEKNIWDINSSTNQENVDNQNLDGQKDNSLFNNNIKLVLIIASITMIIGIIWFGFYRLILRKKQTIKTN